MWEDRPNLPSPDHRSNFCANAQKPMEMRFARILWQSHGIPVYNESAGGFQSLASHDMPAVPVAK